MLAITHLSAVNLPTWCCFSAALSWVHLGLSPPGGLQGGPDVLWNKVSCLRTSPSHSPSTQKHMKVIALQETWKHGARIIYFKLHQSISVAWQRARLIGPFSFQRRRAMSNLGSHQSLPGNPAQHAQWRQRGHSSLMAANIAHQRAGSQTGWPWVWSGGIQAAVNLTDIAKLLV